MTSTSSPRTCFAPDTRVVELTVVLGIQVRIAKEDLLKQFTNSPHFLAGGPLLCEHNGRWTVFGVTSFGEGCGQQGKFGIYAQVPNFVEWILSVVNYN